MSRRRVACYGVMTAGAVLAVNAIMATAWAHVTVTAPGVTVGASDATITLRVPDESATASTVGLKVQLPLDTPLAGVLVSPLPGWTAKIIQTKLATPITTDDGQITQVVSEIDWTAAGAGIEPGYFGQFSIIAGKLPDHVTTLTFRAIQTYSDGKIVSWNQVPAPGSTDEPDFPAPTLDLAAASSRSAPISRTAATTDAASRGAATTGIVLGAAGLVLGGAALALTLTRRRRTTPEVNEQ